MPVIDLGSVVGPQGQQGVAGATGAQGIQGNPGPNQVTNQTSTNLNGVLFGNQSRVAVKPVDSAPTADSTNLVSSGGTDKAIKGRVPVFGLGENLLDNWYFVGGGSQLGDGVFPINQRGQTQYTLSSLAYTLDRWRAYVYSGSASVNLTASGMEYSGENTAFSQVIKVKPTELLGKTVTLSGLVDENLVSATAVMPTSFSQSSTVITIAGTGFNLALVSRPSPVGWTGAYFVAIGTASTTAKLVKAVKLEFGSEQTLCHNEGTAEAPVWVLNEIPDYGEEWNKCRRYLRVYGRASAYANSQTLSPCFSHEARSEYALFAFPIDPPMVSAPTITNNSALGIRTITSGSNVADVTFSFPNASRGAINIRADSTNITAGTLYWVDTLNTGSQLILSAEL